MSGSSILRSLILLPYPYQILYKRLMATPPAPTLEDLRELHPEVLQSLSKLLTFEAEELASMGLTFQVRSGRELHNEVLQSQTS